MERSLGHVASDGAPRDVRIEGEPAIRDAAEILARAAADEAEADRAREGYRTSPIQPDHPRLPDRGRPGSGRAPGRWFARLRSSSVAGPQPDGGAPTGLAGALYVTSRRLILRGRMPLAIDLRRDRGSRTGRRAPAARPARREGRLARGATTAPAAGRDRRRASRCADLTAAPPADAKDQSGARYRLAASARFRAPSLCRTLLTCVSTVRGEMVSDTAISRSVSPSASRREHLQLARAQAGQRGVVRRRRVP